MFLVNAVGMDFGGGRRHVRSLVAAVAAEGLGDRFTFVVSDPTTAERFVRVVPPTWRRGARRRWWDQIGAARSARAEGRVLLALNGSPPLLHPRAAAISQANTKDFLGSPLRRAAVRYGALATGLQIYPSEHMRAIAGNRRPSAVVIPHGVDAAFAGRTPLGERSEGALFPALPWGHKRVDDAVRALALVRQEFPLATLTLTFTRESVPRSERERVTALERLSSELGVGEAISFVPTVAPEAMPALHRSHLVVLALSETESYGLTLAEALASGTPLIATDIPAHREIVGEHVDEDVALVRPGDVSAVAAQWAAVLRRRRDEPAHVLAPSPVRGWNEVLLELVEALDRFASGG